MIVNSIKFIVKKNYTQKYILKFIVCYVTQNHLKSQHGLKILDGTSIYFSIISLILGSKSKIIIEMAPKYCFMKKKTIYIL